MSPVIAAILDRVRAARAELAVDGSKLRWRSPEPLPDDLLADLKERKSEVLAALRVSGALDAYRRRIATAGDWQELYNILADADISCVEGVLAFDDIDTLCALARWRSRRVPQDTL